MKLISLLLISFIFNFGTLAYTISSSPSLDTNGAFIQNITIQCQNTEKQFCQTVCQNDSKCQAVEPLCLDCAGSSTQLLRTIFSRISTYYEPIMKDIDQKQVAKFLATPNYILLSTKSIYNFYKTFDSVELQTEFARFCPKNSQLPLLAVVLNDQSQPTDLVYAFCQFTNTQKKAETRVFAIVPKTQIQEFIKLLNN